MLNEFLDYLDAQVGVGVYVWGAQGERAVDIGTDAQVEAWMHRRYASQSSSASANNANAKKAYGAYLAAAKQHGRGKVVFYDCSGLGMYFIQNVKKLSGDMTAAGMYRKCAPIKKAELQPGDFVFKRSSTGAINHIGYVARDGRIIESEKSGSGVIKRALSATGWALFGRPEWWAGAKPSPPVARPTLRRGSKGADVKTLQNLLIAKGYSLPHHGADGDFGGETEAAVKAYQAARKLVVDGVVGAKTWSALLEVMAEPTYRVIVSGLERESGINLMGELQLDGFRVTMEDE